MKHLKIGDVIPALQLVRATEVRPGSIIWAYQERIGEELVFLDKPFTCTAGSKMRRSPNGMDPWLGPGYGFAEVDSIMLVEVPS